MGVELKTITRDDILPLFQMSVADDQVDFIVHNAMTISQAAFEPNASILGIWAKDKLVGLTTLVDLRGYPFIGDGHDPMSCYIWRIMIDQAHQRRGYGRAALFRIEDWARERQLKRLFVATVQANTSARNLYRSAGFRPTGRVVAGEMEFTKPIKQRGAAQKRA